MTNSPINMMNLPASNWVQRFAPLVPEGEVLDLACGTGRHTRLLAALGHPVLAVDRKLQVLAYEDGPVDRPNAAQVQRLCAAGPAFGKTEAKLDHIVVRNEP